MVCLYDISIPGAGVVGAGVVGAGVTIFVVILPAVVTPINENTAEFLWVSVSIIHRLFVRLLVEHAHRLDFTCRTGCADKRRQHACR